MREEFEFFPVADLPWTPAGEGVAERVLSRGEGPTLTRVTRWRERCRESIRAGL